MCVKNSKHKTDDFHIETIYDPYRKSPNDKFDEIYQRYLDDDSMIIEINGAIYYKAAQISKLTIRNEHSLEVVLPWKIEPEKDCIIIDENGNQYKYLSCETMSFGGEIPEWYYNMVFAVLSVPEGNIGKYFAKRCSCGSIV